MDLTVEPKYIDKPWKVTLWLYLVDGMLKFPLRFLRPTLKTWDVASAWDFLSLASSLLLLVAIFLTGLLYVKSTKKPVEKDLRLKVSLYFAAITFFFGLVFSTLVGFDEKVLDFFFGGILWVLLTPVLTFLEIYFILPLGNKFLDKK